MASRLKDALCSPERLYRTISLNVCLIFFVLLEYLATLLTHIVSVDGPYLWTTCRLGVRHEEWLPGTEFSCFSVVSKPPTFSIFASPR